jgi:transcriptional regulator with XRE-family HTH domain
MSTVNERIKALMIYKKINQTDLSKVLICKPQLISNWLNNKETASDRMVVKLVQAYSDINARWLITGEGVMLSERNPDVLNDSGCQDYGKILEVFESKFEAKYELKVEECGMLKERVRRLTEEIQRLKGDSGREPVVPQARTG